MGLGFTELQLCASLSKMEKENPKGGARGEDAWTLLSAQPLTCQAPKLYFGELLMTLLITITHLSAHTGLGAHVQSQSLRTPPHNCSALYLPRMRQFW